MNNITNIIQDLCDIIWGWPMILLLVGTHIFLTFRLKIPQRKLWKGIKLSVSSDKDSKGDINQFGALATSLAATIGTGNIIGVATAVSLGGPGAIFWCWLTGMFGIATKYGEGLLAIKYRVKRSNGKMSGGPMHVLERGLGMKWLGVLFCIFTAIAAFGIGNTVQANAIGENVSNMMKDVIDVNTCKWIVGTVIASIVAIVIIGGVKSIAKFCSILIPTMSVLYILGCIYILWVNHSYIWDAICWIVQDAFSLEAATGGTVGCAIMTTIRFGVARGLFSNESGMGSAPIVAAAAQTKNPVRQALIQSTAAFWDTAVICTITGLVIITSILAYPEIDLKSTSILTELAFSKIPYVGSPILTIGIITFAFSTIIGWEYYGERAIEYLFGNKAIRFYRIAWVFLTIVGCVLNLDLVWCCADMMNALMAIPNLLSLLLLSGVLSKETQYYLWNNHIDDNIEC